ncbi:hypothetical protein DI396_07085 [Litorivita pollutaquae]|uniref:Uncharacterized protein n=1 Tax=Litorivita pollutaquae TaxID=2200892 RepID=A0A2V4MUD8_9RHOB|nr:hypothetical protein DI396_07085 [Litorivita pollutaquae]
MQHFGDAGKPPLGERLIRNEKVSAHIGRAGGSTRDTTTRYTATGLTKTQSLDGRALNAACGQRGIGNARIAFLKGSIAETLRPRR